MKVISAPLQQHTNISATEEVIISHCSCSRLVNHSQSIAYNYFYSNTYIYHHYLYVASRWHTYAIIYSRYVLITLGT